MSTDNSYMRRLYDFLERLSVNNNREWFRSHRDEYDELRAMWLDDVDVMIGHMAAWQPDLKGVTARKAAYRIYRDTRFSLDKTPFKTYFSASISPYGRNAERASFYLQCGPLTDGSGLFGGIWCPSAPLLRKLRTAIVDNIEEWDAINANPELNRHFTLWTSGRLKTVPKGYDRNHPQAHWLRMKDYGRNAELGFDFFRRADWPVQAASLFRLLKPFNDFLNYSIDE